MRNRSLVGRVAWPIAVGAALSIFGFIPLMGLPGAISLELVAALFGQSERLAALGPSVWGLAIFATWSAGPGVPLGCWTLWAARSKATPTVWVWFAAGLAGYVITGFLSSAALIFTATPEV